MDTELIRRLSPEEEELAAKRNELVLLEAQLADRERARKWFEDHPAKTH